MKPYVIIKSTTTFNSDVFKGWYEIETGSISISTSAPTAEEFSADLPQKRTMMEKHNNE